MRPDSPRAAYICLAVRLPGARALLPEQNSVSPSSLTAVPPPKVEVLSQGNSRLLPGFSLHRVRFSSSQPLFPIVSETSFSDLIVLPVFFPPENLTFAFSPNLSSFVSRIKVLP